ncbi:hypothetical protein HRG_014099 [Hirsutella rhossiliensis]
MPSILGLDTFPTLAYIDSSDVRYAIIMLGCIRADSQKSSYHFFRRQPAPTYRMQSRSTKWFSHGYVGALCRWPLLEKVNQTIPTHVAVSDPNMPFLRASKGSVQRGPTTKAYKNYIDAMFEVLNNETRLCESIFRFFETSIGIQNLDSSTDFFSTHIPNSSWPSSLSGWRASGVTKHGRSSSRQMVGRAAAVLFPDLAR